MPKGAKGLLRIMVRQSAKNQLSLSYTLKD